MNKKGALGEDLACRYLAERAYDILERNYRSPYGEIDIIAKKEMLLCFVEVKAWDVFEYSDLEYSIGKVKQERIVKTSRCFLEGIKEYQDFDCRFDVLFIKYESKKIRHFKNAFMECCFD